MPMLFWLGAHRAPLVFAVLLVLWWLPGTIAPILNRPWALPIVAVGVVAAAFVARYSLAETRLDPHAIVERFADLEAVGFAGHNRVQIWKIGLAGFAASPIWGAGLNQCVEIQSYYLSVHGALIGILFDTGLLGLVVFGTFFVSIFLMSSKKYARHLSRPDLRYYMGHRAAWLILLLLLVVDIPFTSGQPKNNILAYMVYMFPMIAMLVYSREPVRTPVATARRMAGQFGPLPAQPRA
jgi:O-antigen ligase